jgi:DNA gyrase/topoisomerase IV subunit A
VAAVSEFENLQGRRQILQALLFATENAIRIVEFCASSSPDAAVTARDLAEAFDITEFQADVILTMQVRRFSPHSVANVRAQLHDVESEIEQFLKG